MHQSDDRGELTLTVDTSKCKNTEELQYLNLMADIISWGVIKPSRTGINTRSFFGNMMRFRLQDDSGALVVPLLTTKRMAYRLIVEELLWFIRGQTDAKVLHDKGVKIWDANSSRAQLDHLGLSHYREGDCGPIYGFQMRHFGAAYYDCDTDYSDQGVNQIAETIENLRRDPYSRRHIICNWNPTQLKQMCLAPCHVLCQFNVSAEGETKVLDCAVYQRSADVPLGVPFNIASYATFTHMIAQQAGLQPGTLVYFTGDTHIYENQIPNAKIQIERSPRPFPRLNLEPADSIEEYTWEHFYLKEYDPHPAITYPFAV
jgi:thymidylate synthase